MRDPREIRGVFPNNLAQLMAREPSVSAFCRAVGLNRTQFNRYLSGESSPRPEVLAKICDHFKVDARILLEPLDQTAPRAEATPMVSALAGFLGPRRLDVSTDLLRNGFYRRWRNSISQPGKVAHMLTHIKDGDGARVYRTCVRKSGAVDDVRDRRIVGVLIGSADSFILMTKFKDGPTMCHGVFEYQHRSIEGVYPGISLFSRARHPNARRLVREVLEYVPSELGKLREVALHDQFCDMAEAPRHVREILTEPLADLQ